ncbi:MAG: 4Fe-4S dicluster domain-containing protein [Gemmatimonadetes bacterium]|nr:MAG: 4Fe-4S dicluster domain-containing protein [Gemmatimonadota bacterium]
MLTQFISTKIASKITDTAPSVGVTKSRCLPMRFSAHPCTECVDICPHHAITLEPELAIDYQRCSECMLCTAVCPADALWGTNVNFQKTIQALKTRPQPVLGCDRCSEADQTISCLGILSEAHLLALFSELKTTVQLNLTPCQTCKNHFILEYLNANLAAVAENLGINLSEKIQLVEDPSQLHYQPETYDRRDFFVAFRSKIQHNIAAMMESEPKPEEESVRYSAKTLPFKKKLLNQACAKLPENLQSRFKTFYNYEVTIGDECDLCWDCVAICPTEALFSETGEDSQETLQFNPDFCTGCDLCKEFCPLDVITINRYAQTHDPQHAATPDVGIDS